VRTLLAFAALVLTVAITGCQRAPASGPAPASVPAGPLTGRLKAEGDALMAQQAYDQAAVKYQAALNEAPNDIPIRYALAVVLSYLPRREETVEQFRTILYRGDPASFEVKAAPGLAGQCQGARGHRDGRDRCGDHGDGNQRRGRQWRPGARSDPVAGHHAAKEDGAGQRQPHR
jgi:tetratricopeptide (TPR) repeat protein